jgi:hypothetical protein
MTGISVRTTDADGVTVVTPLGRLDLSTYGPLRDSLLKCAAGTPSALVVRLGPDFEVASRAMLALFTTVWMKISQWPDIPLVLACETEIHRHDLKRSGAGRFVTTAAGVPEALAILRRSPPRRFHRVQLPNSPTAPLIARTEVRDVCARWDVASLTGDAVFVASELTENVVRHARSESVLRLELRPGALSIAVRDTDPRLAVLTTEEGPRGLEMVDQMCVAWGTMPHAGGGKVVWAVLPRIVRPGE